MNEPAAAPAVRAIDVVLARDNMIDQQIELQADALKHLDSANRMGQQIAVAGDEVLVVLTQDQERIRHMQKESKVTDALIKASALAIAELWQQLARDKLLIAVGILALVGMLVVLGVVARDGIVGAAASAGSVLGAGAAQSSPATTTLAPALTSAPTTTAGR